MSDFRECIVTAAKDGDISQAEADALTATLDSFEQEFRSDGQPDFEEAAARATYEALEKEKARRMWQRGLTQRAQKRLMEDLDVFRNRKGTSDAGEFLLQVLYADGTVKRGVSASVDGRRSAIQGAAMSMMNEMLLEFRQGVLGRRVNAAKLDNVIKEAFGEDTKDAAAKALAQVWAEAAEYLRQRGNKAGMEIGKLENWGLPQAHNRRAIRRYMKDQGNGSLAAGRIAFRKRLMNDLDASRMIDPQTGKPFTPSGLEIALDGVIDNILSDGLVGSKAGMRRSGDGFRGRHNHERFLVFKDADTWLAYQRDFGSGDPFNGMMAHIAMMSRDIAALEVLGPNPENMLEFLKQTAEIEAGKATAGKAARLPDRRNPEGYVNEKIFRADTMWRTYTGAVNTPVGEGLADAAATGRNLITGAALGSATLAAVPSDFVYNALARHFVGFDGGRVLSDLVTNVGTNRQEALAQGLIMDEALAVMGGQARYAMDLDGPGISQVIAQQSLAASGLTAWTQGMRHNFQMSLNHGFGQMRDRSFSQLDRKIQQLLTSSGLTPDDWEALRRVPLHEGQFLTAPEIRKTYPDSDLADRYSEMVIAQTEFAVPSGSLRTRSVMTSGVRAGTLVGEIVRSGLMFKSFSAQIIMGWGYRIYGELAQGRRPRAASYAISLMLTMTLGGALSWQMK
ncbi:MAG: hypothetical protein MRY72_13015, partial [Aquisalinus sp.]|nr:hypothetical protein [Aquisalinus sp.]